MLVSPIMAFPTGGFIRSLVFNFLHDEAQATSSEPDMHGLAVLIQSAQRNLLFFFMTTCLVLYNAL